MANTLGLDDDLDSVELLRGISVVFDLQFSNDEIRPLFVVGDIFSLLVGRFPDRPDGPNLCATAMAFYRLRRALREIDNDFKLTPEVRLNEMSYQSAKRYFKLISAHSGLRLPRTDPSLYSKIGQSLVLIGALGTFGILLGGAPVFPIAALTILTGWLLVHVDKGEIPSDCLTLGNLAKKVAVLNFGKFAADGARSRKQDVWTALVEVLSQHTSLPKDTIRLDTVLLQSQARAQ